MISLLSFTFHYVSIKTRHAEYLYTAYLTLHSTMSLLKLLHTYPNTIPILPLHSTMSLLKHLTRKQQKIAKSPLHSTMSLLKPAVVLHL